MTHQGKKLPRLELIAPKVDSLEKSDKKNDFIIFRNQIHSNKKNLSGISISHKKKSKVSKKYRIHKKNKTKKHKKKSFFNIF